MRSNRVSLIFAGVMLTLGSASSSAQDMTPQEKDKAAAAEADKAKAMMLPPAVVVVPPAKGSGSVAGPKDPAPQFAVPLAPLKIDPAMSLPPSAATMPALGSSTLRIPFRATTAALSAVGRGHEVALAPFTPVRVHTAAVGAVGRGPAPAAAPFTPVTVRTAPLGAIGRPSGDKS